MKGTKVISTQISEIMVPSANKMDHLQLIRHKQHVCRLRLIRLSYDNVVVEKPAAGGDGGGEEDKGSGGLERWIWGGAPEERAL